jgi:hypothetical protein
VSLVDPVWDELGKIDYLLDQLARAVERSAVDRAVYDRLAPTYLERREELVANLNARARRARAHGPEAVPLGEGVHGASAVPADVLPAAPWSAALDSVRSAAAPAPVAAPATVHYAAPYGAPSGAPTSPPFAPNGAPPPPPPARRPAPRPATPPRPPISAGTWMTYAGAFLVIVAVAIFTIYAWGLMPPTVKLLLLLVVTAGFYAGGDAIRTRMGLPAVGIALVGVGSAMLLFDGWTIISGFGLSGPWPWAVVLLVCSVAYWATELRIAGGWFGAIGAASQVGWWWMLGQSLHLATEWQIAGVAVVALAWALGAKSSARVPVLSDLSTVLRAGSGLLAIVLSLGMTGTVLTALVEPATISLMIAAVITALCATAIVEIHFPPYHQVAPLLHAPVFVAALLQPDPSAAITFGSLAVAYGVYAVWRGGEGFAVASLGAAVLAVVTASHSADLDPLMRTGIIAGVLAVAAVGGYVLSRRPVAASGAFSGPSAADAGLAWRWAGVVGLVFAAFVGVPWAARSVPLLGIEVTAAHVAAAAWMLLLWAVVSRVTRDRIAGWATYAWSFYLAAALMAWGLPGLHSAWYATGLVLLAVAWRQLDAHATLALALRPGLLRIVSHVLFVLIPLFGVIGSAAYFSLRGYPLAVLLGVAALAWASDAVRSREWVWLAPAGAFAVAAAFCGGWSGLTLAQGAVLGATAGVVLSGVGLLGPRTRGGWGAALTAGAVLTATLLAPWALPHSDSLTVTLLLLIVAWALAALAVDIPMLFGVAGLFASFALTAGLHWAGSPGAVAVALFPILALLLLAPTWFVPSFPGGKFREAARGLAAAAILAAAHLVLFGFMSMVVGRPDFGPGVLDVGEIGFGVGMLAAGVVAVLWAGAEAFELGTYVGFGSMLIGLFAFLDHGGVRTAEIYLIAIAIYSLAMGAIYVRREVGRQMPASANGVAFAAAVFGPFMLSLNPFQPDMALQHGLWALGLAVVAIAGGLLSRTRVHFFGGITVAALEALWLSRDVLLAMPTWLWIGFAGMALIGGGVTFARRELLGSASRRVSEGLSDWR